MYHLWATEASVIIIIIIVYSYFQTKSISSSFNRNEDTNPTY